MGKAGGDSRSLINEQGLRLDGRRVDELRPIKIEVGILKNADGSAYIQFGKNKIMAPSPFRVLFSARRVVLDSSNTLFYYRSRFSTFKLSGTCSCKNLLEAERTRQSFLSSADVPSVVGN